MSHLPRYYYEYKSYSNKYYIFDRLTDKQIGIINHLHDMESIIFLLNMREENRNMNKLDPKEIFIYKTGTVDYNSLFVDKEKSMYK